MRDRKAVAAAQGDLADTKHEILKRVLGIALAQTAVIVAVIGVAIALVVREPAWLKAYCFIYKRVKR